MGTRAPGAALAALLCFFAACATPEDDVSEPGYSGRRSATCTSWQSAQCDFIADRCGEASRAECDAAFEPLFCKSDQTMQSCIEALGSATCGVTPPECVNVADTSVAVEYCGDFVAAFCDNTARCDPTVDRTSCETQAAAELNCAAAVGVTPTGDACLAAMPTHPCESQELPAACRGVIVL